MYSSSLDALLCTILGSVGGKLASEKAPSDLMSPKYTHERFEREFSAIGSDKNHPHLH